MDTDSQERRPYDNDLMRQMRAQILENRYPDLSQAKRLIRDAGYGTVHVNVSSSDPRTMWDELFSQLDSLGILDDVLLVIAEESGPKWEPVIKGLVAEHRQETENEAHITSWPIQYSP